MLALIPLLPLLGFLINGSWYALGQTGPDQKKASSTLTGLIATSAIFGAFVVSVLVFLQLRQMPAESRVIEQHLFSWIEVGKFSLNMDFRVDTLSTLFTLVITGVGTLIHLYSIGYMSHDESPGKFFSYLNLFCFAMLMLVLGASLPILFLGWEGVGLCSYLLIGYWYTDIEKAKAGKKAFVANRVGDLGFLLGMFLLFSVFGTLDTAKITSAVAGGIPIGVSEATITAICLLLFVGCAGKSAQIPLYVWLPDAMAGPTPVSALIHAATMVTSGIYMLARLNTLFTLSPFALQVISIVGGLTAFLAASIAIAQRDIKKVLAYSTISQLGYMFLGCGTGAYVSGVFHVITHAFFKALLFLGAGSVIHGMHEEQDIFKMGGLRTRMPKTFLTFAVGWLAICGIPPFSGFFSKDEILWVTYSSPHGSKVLWFLAAMTAMMTAFYMTRLFYLTFLGSPRFKEAHGHTVDGQASAGHSHHGSSHGASHGPSHGSGHGGHAETGKGISVHESPLTMVLPLGVLAVLSAIGGFMGIPHMSWLEHWLEPVISGHHALAEGVSPSTEWVLMGVSVLGAVVSILFAFKTYRDLKVPQARKKRFEGLHRFLENKWMVDEFYEWSLIRPIYRLSLACWKFFDVQVIDQAVLSFGRASEASGRVLRMVQSGSVQIYAFLLVLGLVATVGYLIYGLA